MALTHAYNSYRKWSTVKMAAEEDDEDIWDSWEDMADSGVMNLLILFLFNRNSRL